MPVVSEKLFKNVNRRRTAARTPDGQWTTDRVQSQKLILSICSG